MISKFNWGHGITLFYIIFVGTVVFVLIASTKIDHSLVLDDYYSLDLDYQNRYNKIQNAQSDKKINVQYNQSAQEIHIQTQSEASITGQVNFYKASDKSLDFSKMMSAQNTIIDTKNLVSGKWTIKIDCTLDETDYYLESEIYL